MKAKILFWICCAICFYNVNSPLTIAQEPFSGSEANAFQIGVQAYVFGYPLVLMDATREIFTHVPLPWHGRAPVNEFAHLFQFVTDSFTNLVSPNVDVLYSVAWLDLKREPVILHVPDTDGRYYVLPLIDAWTNVFYSIGKRTTGTQTGDFVIVGPGWRGMLPQGIPVINAPTDMVWAFGRIECRGPAEYTAVNAIQRQLKITPLHSYGSPPGPPTYTPVQGHLNPSLTPQEQVDRMDAHIFFNRLSKAMHSNPPVLADAPMAEMLRSIGISRDVLNLDINSLGEAAVSGLQRAIRVAQESIDPNIIKGRSTINGWIIYPPKEMGNYGTNYLLRAIVSKIALGANLAADTVYAYAHNDSNGYRLNGTYNYVLHFNKDQIPPVNAFWSVTMYNHKHQLVRNPWHRYGISSHSKIIYNEDGSLDILFQHQPPKDKNVNWLPVPEGDFNLILRLYWPKQSVLDNTWKPPSIIRKKYQ